MTRDEAIARLLAVPALPRGERLALFAERNMDEVWPERHWVELFDGDGIPRSVNLVGSGFWPSPEGIRKHAAPLRRASEERRAGVVALRERIKQLEGALADLCGAADELYEAKISAGEFDDTLHDARAALAGGGK